MTKSTTANYFREISIIYNHSEIKPGLFKFEVLSLVNETIADWIIKNAFPYEFQEEMTVGQRDFNPLELSKYPVCVVPYRYGELVKDMTPSTSLVTCKRSILYTIILKEPTDNIYALVKCGYVKADISFSSDYYKNNNYYLSISFSEIWLYDCIILVNHKA